jgi:hypothetical protein
VAFVYVEVPRSGLEGVAIVLPLHGLSGAVLSCLRQQMRSVWFQRAGQRWATIFAIRKSGIAWPCRTRDGSMVFFPPPEPVVSTTVERQ